MKKLKTILLALVAAVSAMALNPLDHTTLLNDHDKDNPRRAADDIDMEAPYFILTGEADKAIAEGDYYVAAMRLRDALRCDPDNPSNALLLSNLGMVYNYLNQDSLALDAYGQALAIAPSMTVVLNNRALLELKMGRDADALRDFSSVIERDSLNVDARYYHGVMSLYGGRLPEAEADFAVLERVVPESSSTWAALSTLYSLTGRDAKAVPYFEKLMDVDPSPEYCAGLAGCLLALGELSKAGETISQGLEKWPDDAELYYYRAWLNHDSYLLDQARADAKRAVALGADPRKVGALFK